MMMDRPATKTFLHRRRRTSWHPSFRLIYVTGIESSDTFSEESHKQRARILLLPCVRKQTVASESNIHRPAFTTSLSFSPAKKNDVVVCIYTMDPCF
ncbi:hypothetical protein PsorP6_015338 [Peronosclerospora sorghi]|uniref:Uncharacterized protein n=1 Tax=Peronosclerospora sorghi TaxID=230839 RepID=A0ACC0VRW9_9STRA|nr:hypothetical protein PsorP6_015338 [Peronosclerospora sorghi]